MESDFDFSYREAGLKILNALRATRERATVASKVLTFQLSRMFDRTVSRGPKLLSVLKRLGELSSDAFFNMIWDESLLGAMQ